CARADGVMTGNYDMDEAIRRIIAFEKAGADLLYVPLVPDADSLRRVVGAVSAPVNALAAGAVAQLGVSEMASMGVRRISVGSMIARLTHAAIRDATRGMLENGRSEEHMSELQSRENLVCRLLLEKKKQ